jgi:hypothetical protein
MKDKYGALMKLQWQGKIEAYRKKPILVLLYLPHHIPQWLAWKWTQASVVGCWWLTASAMSGHSAAIVLQFCLVRFLGQGVSLSSARLLTSNVRDICYFTVNTENESFRRFLYIEPITNFQTFPWLLYGYPWLLLCLSEICHLWSHCMCSCLHSTSCTTLNIIQHVTLQCNSCVRSNDVQDIYLYMWCGILTWWLKCNCLAVLIL